MTFKLKLDLANLKTYLHTKTYMYHHATFAGCKIKASIQSIRIAYPNK